MRLRAVRILTLLLAFTSFAFGQQSLSEPKTTVSEFDASKAQTVEYCELMQKPKDHILISLSHLLSCNYIWIDRLCEI